jgi:hypothetical protein
MDSIATKKETKAKPPSFSIHVDPTLLKNVQRFCLDQDTTQKTLGAALLSWFISLPLDEQLAFMEKNQKNAGE